MENCLVSTYFLRYFIKSYFSSKAKTLGCNYYH